MIEFILKLFNLFFSTKEASQVAQTRPFDEAELDENEEVSAKSINWENPEAKISEHFVVKDALFLPSWGISHTPSEAEKENIVILAKKLDLLVDKFGKMEVHCWIRPLNVNCVVSPQWHGQNYNASVGSSAGSGHVDGRALDFHFAGKVSEEDCEKMRLKLICWLEPLGLRMEKNTGKWIHLDIKPVAKGGNRFFRV